MAISPQRTYLLDFSQSIFQGFHVSLQLRITVIHNDKNGEHNYFNLLLCVCVYNIKQSTQQTVVCLCIQHQTVNTADCCVSVYTTSNSQHSRLLCVCVYNIKQSTQQRTLELGKRFGKAFCFPLQSLEIFVRSAHQSSTPVKHCIRHRG